MMRSFIFGILIFLFLAPPFSGFGEEGLPLEVAQFLKSRRIICTIHFAEGSSVLSSAAKMEIDRIIPRLSEVDSTESLIRIEGFASPGGGQGKNVPISMKRAKAVTEYIQNKMPTTAELFLTGFGAREASLISDDKGCRAEIALYDNIWKMNGLSIEKVVKR